MITRGAHVQMKVPQLRNTWRRILRRRVRTDALAAVMHAVRKHDGHWSELSETPRTVANGRQPRANAQRCVTPQSTGSTMAPRSGHGTWPRQQKRPHLQPGTAERARNNEAMTTKTYVKSTPDARKSTREQKQTTARRRGNRGVKGRAFIQKNYSTPPTCS